MTTNAPTREALIAEFDQAWRDGAPVFGCCRKSVAIALEGIDEAALASADVTTRVNALRDAVEAELPGHLDGHRCCVGHLADVAFDLPSTMPETV